MKKSKFISSTVITALLITMLFTGCSKGIANENGKTKILFFSNKSESVKTYASLIEKFEAENPDIDVELSAPSDATTVLKTKFVKGDMPEIISLGGDRSYSDFVDANILEYLTVKIDFDSINPVYNKMLKDLELEKKEGIYGVPYALNASGVIYNKDIFKQLGLNIPKTWDELIETAKIVESNGLVPFYFTLKDAWTALPAWNTIASTLVSNDSFKRVNNKEVTFNELYEETTDKVTELLQYGHSDNFGVGYNDGNIAFARGNSAMYIQGNYAIAPILSVNPDLNIGMFPLPASNNQEENILTSGIDVYFAIPKGAENQEESIRFINFLLREENAKQYIDEQSAFSAVSGVDQEDPKFEAFDEFFEASRVVDFQDHFYPAELPAGDMIQTYLLDGNKDKFLNNFQKEWIKANREFIKK